MASPVLKSQIQIRAKNLIHGVPAQNHQGEQGRQSVSRMQLPLSCNVDSESLSCLLDFMYYGQCSIPTSSDHSSEAASTSAIQAENRHLAAATFASQRRDAPSKYEIPAERLRHYQDDRSPRSSVGLHLLAKGLGLGAASSLLRGKAPLIGQGLPPLGPQLDRLLPSVMYPLALTQGYFGGRDMHCSEDRHRAPQHLPHAAHVPLEEVLKILSDWQCTTGSLPATFTTFLPDEDDEDEIITTFSDVLIAAPLLPMFNDERVFLDEDSDPSSMGNQQQDAPILVQDTHIPALSADNQAEHRPVEASTSGSVSGSNHRSSDDQDLDQDTPMPASHMDDQVADPCPVATLPKAPCSSVLLLPAHGVVLGARCEYFRALLQWKGGGEPREDRPLSTANQPRISAGKDRLSSAAAAGVASDEKAEPAVESSFPGWGRRVLSLPEADIETAILLQVGIRKACEE